jgi:hypothetical protein
MKQERDRNEPSVNNNQTHHARGGKRDGAGRKRGSKSRVNEGLKARILADKAIMPVEFLLKIMREPMPEQRPGEEWKTFLFRLTRWRDDAIEAAKAAAPYTSPRLESVEWKGDPDNPIEVNNNLVVKFVTPP